MSVSDKGGNVSASELMAALQNDPEYQRKTQANEAKRAAAAQELDQAEQPIVADLRDAGFEVSSVWDLVNTEAPYPDALPILLRHLERRGYPDRVMESMGRALAVPPSVFAWDQIRSLYARATQSGEEEGLAVALAASATSAQVDELMDLLLDETRGEVRVIFVRPLLKLGGSRAREVIERLRSDPVLGREANELLKRGRR